MNLYINVSKFSVMSKNHVFFPKYFRLFDFGHFFCPFLKSRKYFGHKKHAFFAQDHNDVKYIFI
jgi:hypothetical protein